MDNILDSVSDFIGKLVATSIVGGVILITAGEVRLAALRKASEGSSRLTIFTERMTKSRPMMKGGLHGTSKKSN